MTITTGSKQSGLIWLILFIFIPAFLLAAWLMWKIFTWKPRYDPYHGVPDPETNQTSNASAQYGSDAVVFVAEFGLSLPIESLDYQWSYFVEESTNLINWTPLEMEWDAVLEHIQTNHAEPQKFYRRMLAY